MRTSSLLVALLGLAALAASAEDLTIVSKVSSGDGPSQTATSYYTTDKMRSSQGDHEFIAEFATGQFTVIDNKKKEYFVMTKQDLEAMTAQMQAQMKKMEESMKDMPPALREKMAGMMGGVAQSIDVHKGVGGRTIAGYSCENWVVSMGELMKNEQCMTTQLALPVQTWDAMKSFSSSLAGMGPMAQNMSSMYDKFKEMKGVPLASTSTIKVMGKTTTSSTEVTEVKKGPIPDSAWVVPTSYKKVDSPAAKMMKK